jgi:hypothetical protein
MEWIIAVLLVVMGVGLIAAGTNGSANQLFNAITGSGSTGSLSSNALADLSTSTTSSGSSSSSSNLSPLPNLGSVPSTLKESAQTQQFGGVV